MKILKRVKIFSSKLPLICWFEVCFQENETEMIKRSQFKPEKQKKGRVHGSNPGSRTCVLISTAAVKTLIACAMQEIAR